MDKPYYSGSKLILLNTALGLGTFIQILDSSIANVAIPYLAGNLSVSADEGTWVITSFAASNAIVLPLTGWLSDYFGRVKLFVWSILLFAVMSFLCGFSTSLTMLVVFRVLQGAVAGSLIPLSQSLIIMNSPPEKRGSALGFWAMIVVVAPLLGPIVGGYFCENYTWRWIFYINVPIGIFSAVVSWIFLRDRESKIQRAPIDWTGITLLAIGVGAIQIMLDKGKDLDWFESNTIIILTLISIISLSYFIVWNYYEKYRVVDFSFFKDKNFLFGTIAITIGYLLFFGSTVIVPLWLQTVQGYTAFWAGLAVAPIGLFPVLLSPVVGRNLNRFDLRYVAAASFIFFAIGFYIQALFTTEVDIGYIMWVRLFQGLGVTIFFIPLVQLSLSNIPNERYASASGLFNFIRILVGSGFGTSLSVELWSRLAIFHHGRIAETINDSRDVVVQVYQKAESLGSHRAYNMINRLVDLNVDQQAFMLSTNDLSYLAAILFLLMVPLPFLCRKV